MAEHLKACRRVDCSECLSIVGQDGNDIQFVRKETNQICMVAIQQDGWAIQYANKQTDQSTYRLTEL